MNRQQKKGFPVLLPMLDEAGTCSSVQCCWLLGTFGVATLQAITLKHTWEYDPHAPTMAAVAIAWLLGSIMGQQILSVFGRTPRPIVSPLWGAAFVGGTLLWLRGNTPWLPALLIKNQGSLLGQMMIDMLTMCFLSVVSTCWLMQPRRWPLAEPVVLLRTLLCLTFGLVLAWMWPTFASLGAVLLLVPLWLLDGYAALSSPEPRLCVSGTGPLESRSGDLFGWLPFAFAWDGRRPWWWIRYLARRGSLPLSLLASVFSVFSNAIWFSVPTPFAAHLLHAGQLWILATLAAGELLAVAAGRSLLTLARGVIGAPLRLLPRAQYQHCWSVAWLSLLLQASSLVLFGLPWLQAPYWLTGSLFVYTLTCALWGMLLPRLSPSITTEWFCRRHLSFDQEKAQSRGQMLFEQALEEQARLILTTWVGVLTAGGTLFCGWLIERLGVDGTLLIVGLMLLSLSLLAGSTIALLALRERDACVPHPLEEQAIAVGVS
jgi:hypothetical protein